MTRLLVRLTAFTLLHASKPGDITDDGSVDVEDLAMLSRYWLNADGDGEERTHCDLNHDGRIDIRDFSILSTNWRWEAIWHTE